VSAPTRPLRRRLQLAAVLVGLGGVASTGGLGVAFAALSAPVVIWGMSQDVQPSPSAQKWWLLANGAVLLASIVLAFSAQLLLVGMGFVCWLQIHRACTGRSARDGRVALLLALLHLLLACILTLSGWLAPLFALFALLLPLLLLLTHIEDGMPAGLLASERQLGRLWAVAPGVLFLTTVLFFTIPRLDAGGIGAGAGGLQAGFSGEMSLGDMGQIQGNPDIALRATVTDDQGTVRRGPFYFRGTALERFDGVRWEALAKGRVSEPWGPSEPRAGEEWLTQRILQQPQQGGVLFAIPAAAELESESGKVWLDLDGSWRSAPSSSPVALTIRSIVINPRAAARAAPARHQSPGALAEHSRLRDGELTVLPQGLEERLEPLAAAYTQSLPEDASDLERAEAIVAAMQGDFEYTQAPSIDNKRAPLEDFLFQTQRGHCEYFATGLAVLLRSEGIPARVVTGFYGGEWNRFGGYLIVRQGDAHAWVEAWIDGQGWVTLDSTPAMDVPPSASMIAAVLDYSTERWERLVLDYDLNQQFTALRQLIGSLRLAGGGGGASAISGGMTGAVALLGGLIIAGRLFSMWMQRMAGESVAAKRPTPIQRAHRLGRALVKWRGWEPPEGLPPVSAAEWLVAHAGAGGQPMLDLAWMLYRTRYGGRVDGRQRRAVLGALGMLWRQLPRR
jgi:transglutaminase-like putative cysteine protease